MRINIILCIIFHLGETLMKKSFQKTIAIITILLLSIASLPLVSNAEKLNFESSPIEQLEEDKELDLLRGEHVLVLKAEDDVSSFNVRYAFPPSYQYQVPILFELLENTTASILKYSIDNDTDGLNKVVNFTIGAMNNGENVTLHFNYWVLVRNNDYSDFPEYVKIPEKHELPEDTKQWLVSTKVVQVDNILIKLHARKLRGFNDNLIRLADKTASFIKYHRYLSFLIQVNIPIWFSQDAVTTLLISADCVGRSNLGCALFRANNVPARVLLVNPPYKFWTQMNYIPEYYCPGYGWVMIEDGKTPHEPKNQIVNRICFPDDENNTHTDYIFRFMKCEENWLWIDNEHVLPYYVDCREGSKSKMFNESEVITCSSTANDAFFFTQTVFRQYEQHLGTSLTGENLGHFQNATSYQMEAIQDFKDTENPYGYIYLMRKANDEYKKIEI